MDRATPNLPSRDFDATLAFYAPLGFEAAWRDGGWMILERGTVTLEFFAHPTLDPAESWFSCCLRLDDIDGFYRTCVEAGVAQAESGAPRLVPAREVADGLRMAALVDADGTLLRLIGR